LSEIRALSQERIICKHFISASTTVTAVSSQLRGLKRVSSTLQKALFKGSFQAAALTQDTYNQSKLLKNADNQRWQNQTSTSLDTFHNFQPREKTASVRKTQLLYTHWESVQREHLRTRCQLQRQNSYSKNTIQSIPSRTDGKTHTEFCRQLWLQGFDALESKLRKMLFRTQTAELQQQIWTETSKCASMASINACSCMTMPSTKNTQTLCTHLS